MSLKNRKLGRTSDHRKAMLRAMVTYLLENGQIKTTLTRAKEVAPVAEKMITLAKDNTLVSYRQALGFITKEDVANKLFKEIGPKYADRNGGYTRIVRIGPRRGDAAEMAIIQLVYFRASKPVPKGTGFFLYPERSRTMKIIDAHLHLFPQEDWAEQTAQGVGHHNSVDHLRQVYGQLGMVHGVVMGNHSLETGKHDYPADLFHYCVGLDSLVLDRGRNIPADLPDQVEEHLKRDNCCGVKLYPGYNRIWLSDDCYQPIYDLAARYDKPVAIHMGLTAFSRAHLKYCHPLALDEVAADHPKTRFVMCHFGNPFLESAAAVVEKNPNVATDLSGLLEGRVELDEYFRVQAGYAGLLRTWLTAICQWDDVMYGTDWPIVNLGEYIRFIQGIVPEVYWEKVFFHNANRIYGLGL